MMEELQLLRQHHDAERFVLSVWELREHERVLVNKSDRSSLLLTTHPVCLYIDLGSPLLAIRQVL